MSQDLRLDETHVLVVDDDPDVRELILLALESEGARTTIGEDGNQAITALRTEIPDLVVLDMMLPHRSGFLVLEEIQKLVQAVSIIL